MQKEFYSIYLCSRYVHTHRYFQLRFNIREIDDTLRDTCPLMDRLLYVRYTGTKEMQKEFHSIYLCSRCIHTHRYFQLRFNIREIDDTLMNFDPIVCYIYNILEQRKCKKSSIRSIFVRDAFIPIATFNFISTFEKWTMLRDTCPLIDRLLYIRYIGTKEMQKEFHSTYLCSRCVHTHRYFQLRFNIREGSRPSLVEG